MRKGRPMSSIHDQPETPGDTVADHDTGHGEHPGPVRLHDDGALLLLTAL